MHIEETKNKLVGLVERINSECPSVGLEFHQQTVTKKNMCIKGCNGSLWVEPVLGSYDIGLSGKSLTEEMQGFMLSSFGERTGYKQTKPILHHPFWRVEKFKMVEEAIYRYAGLTIKDAYNFFQDEKIEPDQYFEGATKTILVNSYERNPRARDKCIEHYGLDCTVCGFCFEKLYGQLGKGFIHVHHLNPISEIGEEYVLNPIKDLRPVCPNCHAMLHRKQPPLAINELISLINKII